MRFIKNIFVLMFLLIPAFASAQARPATCSVRPLYVSGYKCHEYPEGQRCGRLRSGNLGSIGTFQTDGSASQTVRSFNYDGTKDLVVTVGIEQVSTSGKPDKPLPYEIKLAIAVSDKEEKEVFESVNSSEASTLYRDNWNLTVSRSIKSGEGMYLFTLDCKDADRSVKGEVR